MQSRDIHYGHPTVSVAIDNLKAFISSSKGREKIIEVITGYGSTGGTHRIKTAALDYLEELKKKHYIKDYICGNELDIFCSKYQNFSYRTLIPEVEKRKQNAGSIFIVL